MSLEASAALRIQSAVRMWQSQSEMSSRREQTMQRKTEIRRNDAARCIQLAVMKYIKKRAQSTLRIQKWWKVAQAMSDKRRKCQAIKFKCELEYKSRAAATIQAFHRGCRDRTFTLRLRTAYHLQSIGRSMLARRHLSRQQECNTAKASTSINALLIIQKFVRKIITTSKIRASRLERLQDLDHDDAVAAAQVIQRFYRSVSQRRREEGASRKLQRAVKIAFGIRKSRQKALASPTDVMRLQRICRGMITRKKLFNLEYTMLQEDRQYAAEVIQKNYRSTLCRRKMRQAFKAALQTSNQLSVLLLQRAGRSMLSKQRLVINNMKRQDLLKKGRNMNKAIKTLQRIGKGCRGRHRLHLLYGIVKAPEIIAADREPSPPSGFNYYEVTASADRFSADELPSTSITLSPVKKVPFSSIPWRQMRGGGRSSGHPSSRSLAGPSLSSPANRKALKKTPSSTTGAVMRVVDEWRTFESRHRKLTTFRPRHKSLTTHPSIGSPYATKPRGAAYGHSVILPSPTVKKSAFLPSLHN